MWTCAGFALALGCYRGCCSFGCLALQCSVLVLWFAQCLCWIWSPCGMLLRVLQFRLLVASMCCSSTVVRSVPVLAVVYLWDAVGGSGGSADFLKNVVFLYCGSLCCCAGSGVGWGVRGGISGVAGSLG